MRPKTVTAVLCALIALGSVSSWAELPDPATADRVLTPQKALPPEMVKGDHFEVLDPVVNVFTVDYFRISSDYGEFDAVGQMMLRIRLREIAAMARLDEVKKKEIVAGALKREAKKSVGSVVTVVKHPIKSVKGIGAGIANRFKKIKRDVVEDVGTIAGKDSAGAKTLTMAGRYLGVEKSYRQWCSWLGIDPYTSNDVLYNKLVKVATVDAGWAVGSKVIVPRIPGTGIFRDVYKAVWSYDARELLELNAKYLIEVGIPKEELYKLLEVESLTPSTITALVSAIVELDGVDNRGILLEQASTIQSEPEAYYYLETVLMAAWFHKNEEPLVHMVPGTGIPVGMTATGRLIAFDASDFPHWTEQTSALAIEFDSVYHDLSDNREVWIAGNAAWSYQARIAELGWTAVTGVRSAYLPRIPWGLLPDEFEDEEAYD